MLKNYFKTAWRSLWRNKNFTIINISGLAVGIAVCLVIFLLIQFELSFDGFHRNRESIYRVLTELHGEDGTHRNAGVPFPLPTTLKKDYPDMKISGVYRAGDDQVLVMDESGRKPVKKFREEDGFFFAEPGFFEIFSFPLLAGDWTELKDPNKAVVTKETAERYFGHWQNAIGKIIRRNNNQFFTITGVLENVPPNTDLQLDIVASYSTLKSIVNSTDWISVSGSHGCYLLLPEGMSHSQMNERLKSFSKKYKTGDNARNIQLSQSMSEVHFDEDPGNYLERTISRSLINTLWLIGVFILLIACVNFINLSTAQSINRAREVGVRKVLGSSGNQLKLQFFAETTIITLAAILVSMLLAIAILPYLNSLLDLSLSFNPGQNPAILLFLLGTGGAVILLSGFYPALVLSRFNPVAALKSRIKAGRTAGISLRRGLVILQFVIAQALIIGTLIIVRQMDHFRNQPLGFTKEAIINVSFPSDSAGRSKINYLRDQLERMRPVQSVSFSFASPADEGNWYSNFRFNRSQKETDWAANLKWADHHYLKTYDLNLSAGRNLVPSDTVREFLVNETLLKRLGITNPADGLNKEIEMWGGQMKGLIVGVLKDFNSVSLREAIVPVIIASNKETYSTAGIRLSTADMQATLGRIGSLWNQTFPDYVFEQQFLDEKIDNFYEQESRLSALYKIFAGIAIFLSCLGLYGLASFMAVQRVKEVGIRKVLGASVQSIVMLFSREFLVLIGIAFFIAAPVACYFMDEWLQDFVYRISIPWWIVLMAGLIAVLIAMITISFQAVRAGLSNPVKNLRTE